jgi:hypothetical protein
MIEQPVGKKLFKYEITTDDRPERKHYSGPYALNRTS